MTAKAMSVKAAENVPVMHTGARCGGQETLEGDGAYVTICGGQVGGGRKLGWGGVGCA